MKKNLYKEINKSLKGIRYIRKKDKVMRKVYGMGLTDDYTVGTEEIINVVKHNIKVYLEQL